MNDYVADVSALEVTDFFPFCAPSFEAPRNLHPDYRLSGYCGHGLYESATPQERKAWEEGRAVREEVRRVVALTGAAPVAFRKLSVMRPTGGKPYALAGMGWKYYDYDPGEYEGHVKNSLLFTGDKAVQCETTVQLLYAHVSVPTGHGNRLWTTDGGRQCPLGWDDCSQVVLVDLVTGEYDYGDPGGPGWADCEERCPRQMQPYVPEPYAP